MSPTPFSAFADVCRRVEAISGRKKKIDVLASFLRSLHPNEVAPALTFFTGHAFPGADERVLDVGGRTIWKMDRTANQSTLVDRPATLLDVNETFDQIAKATGSGSRQRKEALVETLLGRIGDDSEYLMRIIFGEMRIGAVEGVILEAVAAASNIQLEDVRRAYMLIGDLGRVGKLSLAEGEATVRAVGVELFTPIRPMLAEMAQDLEEVFREHGGTTALEYKYDGARVQLHVKEGKIRIFSRRLTDVTDSLPDIVHVARDGIVPRARDFLVEGEVVAVGEGGKPFPFQDLMRRFRRVHDVKLMATQIPLRLYLFDVIYLDGRTLIDTTNEERWAVLQKLVGVSDLLATRIVSSKVEDAKELMQQAILAGHEGAMAKDLKSGYTPGVRGKKWFKIKPVETLDVVIVAADWGSGRRKGWLSNYHLAVRDEQTGDFLLVGKTFKGLTDEEFSQITEKLLTLKTRATDFTVHVKPSIVVEVAFNEIQRSPHYRSRFALRFARITRFRDDKRPDDADTQSRLRTLYENQFRFKARANFEGNK